MDWRQVNRMLTLLGEEGRARKERRSEYGGPPFWFAIAPPPAG